MGKNKRLKTIARALTRRGLFVTVWLFAHMPMWGVKAISKVLLPVAFALIGRHKSVAEDSIQIAFGAEKSKEDIKGIVKRCFYNFGKGLLEMAYYISHPKLIEKIVQIEGIENLEGALKAGKGVIAVTAHFGNFPLMMMVFAIKGYKVNAMIRPSRDPLLEEYLLKKRQLCGLKTVYSLPRSKCVRESLDVLRNNEILFVPLDQNFGSGGVYVEFFGQKAATATGPVVFAKRTNATILPMFIIRVTDDTHKIIIKEPLILEEGFDEQDTIYKSTKKITSMIEEYVRRYPHEWGWMHRRWKSQPDARNQQNVKTQVG